jgi:hypothetical protein
MPYADDEFKKCQMLQNPRFRTDVLYLLRLRRLDFDRMYTFAHPEMLELEDSTKDVELSA